MAPHCFQQQKTTWYMYKSNIIQFIALCEANRRKCGLEMTWPDQVQWPRSGYRSRVLISCSSLLENYQISILKSILIELGLNPWSWSELDKLCFLKFKRWKQLFRIWMESVLLGHIYHMINNDSISGHTV
jgi:hypothetical protein